MDDEARLIRTVAAPRARYFLLGRRILLENPSSYVRFAASQLSEAELLAKLARPIATGARFAEACELLGRIHGDEASGRAAELLLRWLQDAALAAPNSHAIG